MIHALISDLWSFEFSPLDQVEIDKGTLISDTLDVIPDQPSITIASWHIRRSDRNKKPSGHWNEEAWFVMHPPRSSKKKTPVDPREGTPNLSY